MSSTTGSRQQAQLRTRPTKASAGWGYSPPQQRNHRGGGEGHHHRPHPTGGRGDTMGRGGEGGCGSPASYSEASWSRFEGQGLQFCRGLDRGPQIDNLYS